MCRLDALLVRSLPAACDSYLHCVRCRGDDLPLPLPLLSRLGAEGVETAADVVGLYPHMDLFMDALHAVMGTRVDADLSMDVACIYARVHGLARKAKKHAVELVVAERHSVYPSGAAERCGGREAAASSRGMKPLVGVGGVYRGVWAWTCAGQRMWPSRPKLDLLFHLLVDYVLDLKELGIDAALLADPLGRTKTFDSAVWSFDQQLQAMGEVLRGEAVGAQCPEAVSAGALCQPGRAHSGIVDACGLEVVFRPGWCGTGCRTPWWPLTASTL